MAFDWNRKEFDLFDDFGLGEEGIRALDPGDILAAPTAIRITSGGKTVAWGELIEVNDETYLRVTQIIGQE
ncbi:MAG: FliM/FliN family flagellar motor switch protein [bacterium]|nr:FliM/FliN family flagellar motor switch protein [bacterium]